VLRVNVGALSSLLAINAKTMPERHPVIAPVMNRIIMPALPVSETRGLPGWSESKDPVTVRSPSTPKIAPTAAHVPIVERLRTDRLTAGPQIKVPRIDEGTATTSALHHKSLKFIPSGLRK